MKRLAKPIAIQTSIPSVNAPHIAFLPIEKEISKQMMAKMPRISQILNPNILLLDCFDWIFKIRKTLQDLEGQ